MLAASGGEFRASDEELVASDGVFVAAFLKVVIAYWKPKVEF
jgi:hypothetical protein